MSAIGYGAIASMLPAAVGPRKPSSLANSSILNSLTLPKSSIANASSPYYYTYSCWYGATFTSSVAICVEADYDDVAGVVAM